MRKPQTIEELVQAMRDHVVMVGRPMLTDPFGRPREPKEFGFDVRIHELECPHGGALWRGLGESLEEAIANLEAPKVTR